MSPQAENIALAVQDLREELLRVGFRARLIAEVASFYGLHPDLLARKFKEQHGAELATWQGPAMKPGFEEAAAEADARRDAEAFMGEGVDEDLLVWATRTIRASRVR